MKTGERPRALILAGPNGAGKTTFACEYLTHEADCPAFMNADLIAAGLSPFAPERAAVRAGRLMLELMAQAVEQRQSFAFETTLAARGYARAIRRWRVLGYEVMLYFLSLPSADLALARVAERVRQGGHGVPEATIRRRFEAGRRSFERVYKPIVDAWILYDCGGAQPVIAESMYMSSESRRLEERERVLAELCSGSLAAMRRARKRAEELAARMDTALIQAVDGRLVRVEPPHEDSERSRKMSR